VDSSPEQSNKNNAFPENNSGKFQESEQQKEFILTPIIFGLEINTYSENTEQIAPKLSSKIHKYLEEIPLTLLGNKCYD
jgi:hypothetical protein